MGAEPGSRRITDPACIVKSGQESNAVQEKANVAADNTELSLEREFVEGVSLDHPPAAEADVGKTDTSPYKEVG